MAVVDCPYDLAFGQASGPSSAMNTQSKVVYEFGPFRMDPDNQVLLRDNQPIALTPKAFETLLVLVRRSREAVSKEELLKAIWPDSFVEEANLSQNIFMLRKALGDTPDERRYIVTLPGRGYRFAAPVREIAVDSPATSDILIAQMRSRTEILIEEDAEESIEPRPALPRPARHRPKWLLPSAIVAAIAIAGLGSWLLLRRPRPAPFDARDSVLVADFTNATGDPVFDGTLRQGLSVQLEQSPFLGLVSDERIHQGLRLMGQQADAKLTPEIARELCQRIGSTAVLDGSIAQIGSQYLLTLKVVNCASGDSLASTETQASDKNHVLDALGKTASEMRNKLGESLATVQRFNTPLEQATTASLEALQAYSLGRKEMVNREYAAAVPFFQRAIDLDPDFAMAYARLGMSYRHLGETNLASENSRKSYGLREQVSELEKFYIESHFDLNATGDLEKAVQVCDIWAKSYPRDWVPRVDLADIYNELGDYDKALSEGLATLRLNPTAEGYSELINTNLSLNRFEQAKSLANEAESRNLAPGLRVALYELAFSQNDDLEMARQANASKGIPGVENTLLNLEADSAAYSGKLQRARDNSRQATASAKRAEEAEAAAGYQATAALREALFGNPTAARSQAADALALSNGATAQSLSALALALAGDTARAETLAAELDSRFPENTLVQFYYLPTIRAQLALRHNDPSKAIQTLQAVAPYELSSPGELYPVYVRGQSYLDAHRANEAAAEFQKILDHRGIVVNAPIGALAHLGLARASALSRDKHKAKFEYEEFFRLWSQADSGIPVLNQARTEYNSLQ